MATLTALGPVLDQLIDRAERQQLAAVALVPQLGALLATGGIPCRVVAARDVGSALDGCELLRELRFSLRSS